jgi:hypothetical protein
MKQKGNPDVNSGKYIKDYWTDKVKPKLELITGWARNGLSNEQIALNLGIGITTFAGYRKQHEELEDALRLGREDAEVFVENALFKRATGYRYKEVTKERVKVYDEDGDWTGEYKMVVKKSVTKEVAPDVSAQIYWLEHRAPNRWSKQTGPTGTEFDDGFIDALRDSAKELWEDDEDEDSD